MISPINHLLNSLSPRVRPSRGKDRQLWELFYTLSKIPRKDILFENIALESMAKVRRSRAGQFRRPNAEDVRFPSAALCSGIPPPDINGTMGSSYYNTRCFHVPAGRGEGGRRPDRSTNIFQNGILTSLSRFPADTLSMLITLIELLCPNVNHLRRELLLFKLITLKGGF